jgi:hypothetical protein
VYLEMPPRPQSLEDIGVWIRYRYPSTR